MLLAMGDFRGGGWRNGWIDYYFGAFFVFSYIEYFPDFAPRMNGWIDYYFGAFFVFHI
jgi:hypothetical protein